MYLEDAKTRPDSPSDSSESTDEKSRSRSRSVGRAEKGTAVAKQTHPCRLFVRVNGVEAFLYNHSPAYDYLVSNIKKAQEQEPEPKAAFSDHSDPSDSEDILDREKTQTTSGFSLVGKSNSEPNTPKSSIPSYLRIFPIQIECRKAAAAVGNETSTTIVTAKTENAYGKIDAGRAGELDLWKILFDFDVKNVLVHFKPNQDFKYFQLDERARLSKTHHVGAIRRRLRSLRSFFLAPFRMFWSPIANISRSRRDSSGSIRTASTAGLDEDRVSTHNKVPGQAQWQGLARYLDDDEKAQHDEWDDVEYAKSSQIADVPLVSMRFYWDIPGKVPASPAEGQLDPTLADDPNGSRPPEYGMELSVHGGVVTYGPWADRQRVILQNIFFPATQVDARPLETIRPGEARLPTVFKLHLCLEEDVILRIPMREGSKDWKWKGRAEIRKASVSVEDQGPRKRHGRHGKRFGRGRKRNQGANVADIRPFGWLDLKVAADSTVNYSMDMYARRDGFHNRLDLDVKRTEIQTSVNHGLLWRTGRIVMDGDLSNPLSWNALRTWMFKVTIHEMDLFILRDHMFLIIDLVNDWSSGPPPDFFTFVPYKYQLDLSFINWKIFLNSNDANLINKPADMDDNNFLILGGENLDANLGIPIDKYRPAKNSITFGVLAKWLFLDLHTPSRITLSTLLEEKRVATLEELTLTGSHSMFTETAAGLTDVLQLNIEGTGLLLRAYGFLVRHFINVKENYFGDFMHFKTLEEYQVGGPAAATVEQIESQKHSFRRSNDLDVILCIGVPRPVMLLPANLYSCDNHIRLELPMATADLRVTNYYLDLTLNVSPMTISSLLDDRDAKNPSVRESGPQIVIDGLDFCGHRLFGLPPTEPAYVSNWDVDVGAITGECSAPFVQTLAQAGRSFAFALDDFENAIPLAQTEPIPDAVFLRLKTETVVLWLKTDSGAACVSTEPIDLNLGDWSDSLFSSRMSMLLPNLTVACMDPKDALHHISRGTTASPAHCFGFFQTSVSLSVVKRKMHFTAQHGKQQAHIRRQDIRTTRAGFLIDQDLEVELDPAPSDDLEPGPPAMAAPVLPVPLGKYQHSTRDEDLISFDNESGTSRLAASTISRSTTDGKSLRRGAMKKTHASDRTAALLTTHSPHDLDVMRGSGAITLFSPYNHTDFALNHLEVDISGVPPFSILDDDDDDVEPGSFNEDYFDSEQSQATDHTTIMIKFQPGIRVYVEPLISNLVFDMVSAMLPQRPADIVDTFQMDVMDNVSKRQAARKSKGGMIEVNVNLPSFDGCIRCDESMSTVDDPDRVQDQIDIGLSYLNLTVRHKSVPEGSTDAALIVHTTLETASISMADTDSVKEGNVDGIRLGVEDILVWLVFTQTRSLNISFKDLTTFVPAQQTAYLTAAVPRILSLANQIEGKAQTLGPPKMDRVRFLGTFLAEHAEQTTDPPYLTRMTYILRAFPDHFRNQESWKIVTRFRHTFSTLPPDKKEALRERLTGPCEYPKEERRVLDTWAQWCSWDVPNLERTQIFQSLLGSADRDAPEELLPLELTMQSDILRLLVECGSETNELSVAALAIRLAVIPPKQPTGLMLMEENLKTKILFQAHSAAILLRLHWEILDPIAVLVEAFANQASGSSKTRPKSPRRDEYMGDELFESEVFHVVISTDDGAISLNSINLHHTSRAHGIKLSLLGTDRTAKTYGQGVSALVTAEDAITELTNENGERIWRTDLSAPNVYVDYKETLDQRTGDINIGAAYGELRIDVKQEILGLLSTLDSIVADEMASVKQFQKRLGRIQKQSMPKSQDESPEKVLKFNVAVLAGIFSVEFALLKTLSLTISGKSANVRVTPSTAHEMMLDIEADVGTVDYILTNTGQREHGQRQRAEMHSPPASAHVGLQLLERKSLITVSATVDEIVVEAAAIQGLLTIAGRPEVQSVLEAIKSEFLSVRSHAGAVLRDKNPALAEAVDEKPKVVIYNITTTLSGLKIVATAPVMAPHSVKAELVFGFGAVAAMASNQPSPTGRQKVFPDIQAKIQRIGAKLSLIDGKQSKPCGYVGFGLTISSRESNSGPVNRQIKASSDSLEVNIFADTAATIVDIITYIQRKLGDLDLSREIEYVRRLKASREKRVTSHIPKETVSQTVDTGELTQGEKLETNYDLDLQNIKLIWIVARASTVYSGHEVHDLELSFRRINFSLKGENLARLAIQNLQLQCVPKSHKSSERTLNSALLPEIVLTVRYEIPENDGLKLAFNAAGKALDLRLDSHMAYPVSMLVKSGERAIQKFQTASLNWKSASTTTDGGTPMRNLFGGKLIASLLLDARFDGAVLYFQGQANPQAYPTQTHMGNQLKLKPDDQFGRSQRERGIISTKLQAPGIALKLEYTNTQKQEAINGEMRVDSSSNTILPEMVQIMLQVTESVKLVLQEQEHGDLQSMQTPVQRARSKSTVDDALTTLNTDPEALLGKMRVSFGLRICRQEFGLSCQPLARINAKAQIDDIYVTLNTMTSPHSGHFMAVSATLSKIGVSVQHVYSRESTFSFGVESIVLSLMNSKHISTEGTSGLSAALKVFPMQTMLNVRQIQDLLLFREIWFPDELRSLGAETAPADDYGPGESFLERYQHVSQTAAFPFNATVSIADLSVDLDLGQSIGKSSFIIKNLWAQSKKDTDEKQDLCIGLDRVGISSTGRMSGFIELADLNVRTSIELALRHERDTKPALIEAAVGFGSLRAKTSFDYQPFAFADISNFKFIMYNVRDDDMDGPDRLVAILDGDKMYAFITSTSSAQAVALYQAFDRLVQEKTASYNQAIKDVEKELTRRGSAISRTDSSSSPRTPVEARARASRRDIDKPSVSLHTDVVVTLRAINCGAYPNTFFDSQILKLEATNVQARFAVGLENGRIHSDLGMMLGQVSVALASVKRVGVPKTLGDISMDEVINNASNSHGGVIVAVPRVVASMQTWQTPDSKMVDYIFRSSFQGSIEVGWNFSRIQFIKSQMVDVHRRTLASRLGKPLPESAVKIETSSPRRKSESSSDHTAESKDEEEKIRAVVNVPQSKYEYRALEPPVIETPQLRDLAEATPPLEWIGLHRDRLPNLTHQIIIVTLVELAKEVEDAYGKILGSGMG